jgi:hypothetical protein
MLIINGNQMKNISTIKGSRIKGKFSNAFKLGVSKRVFFCFSDFGATNEQ